MKKAVPAVYPDLAYRRGMTRADETIVHAMRILEECELLAWEQRDDGTWAATVSFFADRSGQYTGTAGGFFTGEMLSQEYTRRQREQVRHTLKAKSAKAGR